MFLVYIQETPTHEEFTPANNCGCHSQNVAVCAWPQRTLFLSPGCELFPHWTVTHRFDSDPDLRRGHLTWSCGCPAAVLTGQRCSSCCWIETHCWFSTQRTRRWHHCPKTWPRGFLPAEDPCPIAAEQTQHMPSDAYRQHIDNTKVLEAKWHFHFVWMKFHTKKSLNSNTITIYNSKLK